MTRGVGVCGGAVPDVGLVVKHEHAGLIVSGMRRRSRVGRLLLGSNAQDIILEADCPVLAVKAPGGS